MNDAVTRQSTTPALVRTMSQTLAAGVAVLPAEQANPEQEPLINNHSRRRQEVARRREEIQNELLQRFAFRFVPALLCFGLLAVSMLCAYAVLFGVALFATVQNSSRPCDQPLKYYLPILVTWTLVANTIMPVATKFIVSRMRFDHSNTLAVASRVFIVRILSTIPGWCVPAWGSYMLWKSKTCPKTNPGMFNALKWFIIAQVIIQVVFFIGSLCLFFLSRNFLLVVSMVDEGLGCKNAIHRLPKVSADSNELIDKEDCESLDCCICMEKMAGSDEAVVRTECAHYFHEECLATWCQSHVECPICRQTLGDLDEKV